MKKILLAVAVTSLMVGCTQRYVSPEEQAMTNAAYKGAAMNQALANAHAAAFDGKSIGGDEHKHKHHHHKASDRDDSDDSDDSDEGYDKGVVYQDGVKGYYDADGEFIQYGQSAHKPVKHDAAFKQVSAEADAVINGTIGDGADFLIGQGWKANKGVWHKKGYILKLVVEDGIVVNAQLTK